MTGAVLQQLRTRENQLFLFATVILGVLAGLAAVLFTLSIERTTYVLFGVAPSAYRLLLVPALVGLLTGVLLAKFFPNARGSGVPQTEVAFHLSKGIIPSRVPIGKFITGVLCVGSGHSMGREGPSVQIGAGIASIVGQWLRLPPDRIQQLVPVAAAAALSAAFNTPVAAVLFALEEIIGDLNAGVIGPAVIASVTAVIVERSILGSQPLFRVPQYHLVSPGELAGYALLGILGGIVSLAFCKGLLFTRSLFFRMPKTTVVLQPAIGGALIGVILIGFPQVMGVGYEYVDQALNGGLVLKTMALLCAAKLVATIISYASGNSGGIFAPSLFLGAMAGGTVGSIVHRLAPLSTGDPGAYALVGMGAVFAGIIRAPMTSVFMIFELTQDYQILVPLMVSNLLSFLISKYYQPMPIYRALLEQDLITLPDPEIRVRSSSARAKDLMSPNIVCISPELSIEAVRNAIAGNDSLTVLIGNNESPVGIIGRAEIEKALQSGKGKEPVRVLQLSTNLPHIFPDDPIDLALERLAHAQGGLLVLSRTGHDVQGIITRETVMNFIGTGSSITS
ncbi:MAG TPA: chloride channel protein [Terriglobales bacterium]|nr:chloride channel protein [Terriglobales bacterium]